MPFSGAFLIESFGWRGSLATQGMLTLFVGLPLAGFLRSPPATDASSMLFLMLLAAIAGRVAFGQIADMIGALPAWILASGW